MDVNVSGDAYPFAPLPAPLRYTVALASIAIVFVIDRFGGGAVDDGSHFLLLGLAVTACAWFTGTGPALAATLLGALMGALLDTDTAANQTAGAMHLALFVIQGLLLTGLVSELRSARQDAVREAAHAQSARHEAETANRMKDEFLGTISHELRTPLNAVLGWVHLLRTGKLDDATGARGLESIERNIRLQSQLTGDLLDVSRALTGKLHLESHPASLAMAAREAADSVQVAARARGATVEFAMPAEPVVVLGDGNRLRQVVWHLLANAIKFSPRDGRIELSVGVTGDTAWVTVRDSGPGIEPEFLPHIFERFTQADSSPTRNAGGLGVGLALVRELVELQGGEVEASNRPDGRGAVFTARFPLQPAESLEFPAGRRALRLTAFSSPPLDGLRVLVLERDPEARELVETILRQRGASVRTVSSVADALELLEGWGPDVLVSDSPSREHDSYALVGKVQSLDADRGGRIPAVALTAAARTDERMSRLLADVQGDVPKPVEPAVLASEIARLTGRERRRAQR